MFTLCAKRKMDLIYHGKEAKTKYLYLSKYSIPQKGSGGADDIHEVLHFKIYPIGCSGFVPSIFTERLKN
jgi:hypothetical protein